MDYEFSYVVMELFFRERERERGGGGGGRGREGGRETLMLVGLIAQ